MSPPSSGMPGRGGQSRSSKEIVFRETGFGPMLRTHWRMFLLGFVLFMTFIIWFGLQPLNGGIKVGICRTFLETKLKYPTTLKLSDVEWYKNILQVYFTHIDAFGENQSEFLECEFNPDLTLADVRRNRVSFPPEDIKSFNMTIPYVISSKPSNIIPGTPRDNLMALKQD